MNQEGTNSLWCSFLARAGNGRYSSEGATDPQWLAGGRELVYVNAERKVATVDVNTNGQELEIGQTRVLFGGHPLPALPHGPDVEHSPVYLYHARWQAHPSAGSGGRSSSPPLTLVTNWTAELRK